MKILCALLTFFLVSEIQVSHAQKTDFFRLVKQKKYTELQKRLDTDDIDGKAKAIYQSILLNVFNKPAKSNKIIGEILKMKDPIPDSIRFMLLETQHDNFVKLYNYAKAYETKQFLMDNYASFYPIDKIQDEIQILQLFKVIKEEAPQTIVRHGNVAVPVTRNFIGLQTIPVGMNNATYPFIFDTGAGFSTVTDSMAEVLKLRIIDKVPIIIKSGITGLGTNIKLGIAEKLSIGNLEARHVVFLVFPDSSLTLNLKEGAFKIDPIIGFPVIRELGSVTIYKDKIRVNTVSSKNAIRPNMAIDYLKPILFMNYQGEDLPFTLDTGADQSVLTEVFYNRYKIMVEKEGTARTASYGGAGGIKNFKVFVLPSIQLGDFGELITLKNISVSTEKISTGNGLYYGNLGQDLIKQYRSMTINFFHSWIKFSN